MGFGCWGIGGVSEGAPLAYGPTEDSISIAALKRALELGMNFFDTSGLYGNGHSEELLGQHVSSHPNVVIATKAGYVLGGQSDFSSDHLLKSLTESLSRLRLDTISLFQLHDPPASALTDKLWSFLDSLRDQGLIRQIGVSLRGPDDGLKLVGQSPVDAIQVNFSLVDQRARCNGLLELCGQHKVSVIARTPLCFGMLTGAPAEVHRLDHRTRWGPQQLELWHSGIQRCRELYPHYPGTEAQMALAFCLSYPEISVTIPGMLTTEQVEENVASLGLPLDPAARHEFEKLYENTEFMLSK